LGVRNFKDKVDKTLTGEMLILSLTAATTKTKANAIKPTIVEITLEISPS